MSGSGEMEAPARREAGVRTHAQPPTRPRLPSLRRRSACLPACRPVSACLSACDAGRHGQGCRPPVALRHPLPFPPLFSRLRSPPPLARSLLHPFPILPSRLFPFITPSSSTTEAQEGPEAGARRGLAGKRHPHQHTFASQSRQARGRLPCGLNGRKAPKLACTQTLTLTPAMRDARAQRPLRSRPQARAKHAETRAFNQATETRAQDSKARVCVCARCR